MHLQIVCVYPEQMFHIYISDALFKNSLMEGCLNLAQRLNAHDRLKTEKGL